jgi:hypothetical protein
MVVEVEEGIVADIDHMADIVADIDHKDNRDYKDYMPFL